MATFEPTKGLAVISCDECATTKILPAKVLHVADEETFNKIINGEQELVAKIEDGYLVLNFPEQQVAEEVAEEVPEETPTEIVAK